MRVEHAFDFRVSGQVVHNLQGAVVASPQPQLQGAQAADDQGGVVRLAPYWEISFLNPTRISTAALQRELKIQ